MSRLACLLVVLALLAGQAAAWPQDKPPAPPSKVPDGVYLVQRDSLKEKELLPLKDTEVLLVNRHRYVKKDENEPLRFLVVRSARDVELALAGAPKLIKEETKIVGILLKLQPKPALALERLTRENLGREVTIVLGGEPVTMHKIRDVIKGGDVQITNCVPGAAEYLFKQLQAH